MCTSKQLPRARFLISLVLWAEIVINLLNGVVSVLFPALALQPLTSLQLSSGHHELGLEASRWFGAMGVTFGGFLLWRVRHTPAALKPVLEALLLGDVLYLLSLAPFALKYGKWPAVIAPFAITLAMFAARLTYLLCEDWPLYELSASREKRAREGGKP